MKYLILVFIFPIVLSAQDLKVFNNGKGIILLTGKSCDLLEKNYQALKKWKLKTESFEGTESKCECFSKECRIDISGVLPESEKEIEGKCSAFSGPNCYNTALITQGILKTRRVSTVDEINFWTDSSLCEEIPPTKKVSPGDLYVLYDKSGLPLHGFTYISPELVFSKGGPAKEMKYNLEPLKNMFGYYKIQPECHHVDGSLQPSACSKYGRAYSCKSIDEFEKNYKTTNKDLKKVLKGLEEIECQTEKNFFPNLYGASPAISLLKTSLQSYRMLIIENRHAPGLSKADKTLWNLAFIKFIALEDQLDLIHLP